MRAQVLKISAVLAVVVAAGCWEQSGRPSPGPTGSPSPGPANLGAPIDLGSGKRVLFASFRNDIMTHLGEVLAGQHQQITATPTLSDQWYMAELPESMMPPALDKTATYDLAKDKDITLRLRLSSGMFSEPSAALPNMGTLVCTSGQPGVSGTLAIMVITDAGYKFTDNHGVPWGFRFYVRYQSARGELSLSAGIMAPGPDASP